MADSFDTTVPEGRVSQFKTMLGVRDFPGEWVERFITAERKLPSEEGIVTIESLLKRASQEEFHPLAQRFVDLARVEYALCVPNHNDPIRTPQLIV